LIFVFFTQYRYFSSHIVQFTRFQHLFQPFPAKKSKNLQEAAVCCQKRQHFSPYFKIIMHFFRFLY